MFLVDDLVMGWPSSFEEFSILAYTRPHCSALEKTAHMTVSKSYVQYIIFFPIQCKAI